MTGLLRRLILKWGRKKGGGQETGSEKTRKGKQKHTMKSKGKTLSDISSSSESSHSLRLKSFGDETPEMNQMHLLRLVAEGLFDAECTTLDRRTLERSYSTDRLTCDATPMTVKLRGGLPVTLIMSDTAGSEEFDGVFQEICRGTDIALVHLRLDDESSVERFFQKKIAAIESTSKLRAVIVIGWKPGRDGEEGSTKNTEEFSSEQIRDWSRTKSSICHRYTECVLSDNLKTARSQIADLVHDVLLQLSQPRLSRATGWGERMRKSFRRRH